VIRATHFIALMMLASLLAAAAVSLQAPPQAPQPPPPGATAPQSPAQTPAQPAPPQITPLRPAETIVIDPGHGGSDSGARGSSGILEKDFTMFLAVLLRDELQRQGLRAAITRQQDENPGFDQRAAVANAYARPIFITLHAGSTGQPGSIRAYYSRVSPVTPAPESEAPKSPLPLWDAAQNRHLDDSRRLALLVQSELKQKFAASPEGPAPAALRQLRSITGPAIAVEISSVAVKERKTLDEMAPGVVSALARGITTFRGNPSAAGAPK
jgi:N-acetylmuramoyl-L-alanine amidase